MAFVLGILLFIVVIMVSVGLHEAGHMITAKRLGIPVPRFFIGFGPKLWSFTRGETEYGIKILPLGGFVQIDDPRQEEGSPERSLLSHVTPWKRILIFAAGPVVNIILGVVIIFTLLNVTPIKQVVPRIDNINNCSVEATNCEASKSDLKVGDTIVKVNGKTINGVNDPAFKFHRGANNVQVKRGDSTKDLIINGNSNNKIGVNLSINKIDRSAVESADAMREVLVLSFKNLSKIPGQVPHIYNSIVGKEKRSQESMSSVVGVGRNYGETVTTEKLTDDDKITTLVYFSGALNLGLGFANLLPLLPLDGGRILIAIMDVFKMSFARLRKIKYNPTSNKTVAVLTAAMGVFVLSFMALVIVADIVAPIKLY